MSMRVLALAIVVGLLVVGCFWDDDEPDESTATATATGVSGATATPTSGGNEGELPPLRQVPGAVTKEMTLGEPYSIEPGELWYFNYLCDACGPGPFPNLYRAYRAADGQLVVDDLKRRVSERVPGNVVAYAADWQAGDAWIAVCQGQCGPMEGGGSLPGFESVAYRSRDGGITWSEVGTVPPQTVFMGPVAGEVLAGTWASEGEGAKPRFWLYPSGTEQGSPQGVEEATYPVVLNGQAVVWRTADGHYYDAAGTELFGPLFVEQLQMQVTIVDPGFQHTYVTWSEWNGTPTNRGWLDEPYYWYVGRIDREGQMRELYGLPGDTLWIGGEFQRQGDKPPALYGRFRFGTSVDYVRDVSFGAVLDLDTAQVHRFAELDAARPPGSFVWMQGLVQTRGDDAAKSSSWLRVTGTGDCLNVRESPSLEGRVLTCLADDVLVGDVGQRQTADGVDWRLVHTYGMGVGWVSAEFVR